MPRLEDLSEVARKGHLNFPAFDHDGTPWTPFTKTLGTSRLALVTTAAIHSRGDRPFTPGDQTFRTIPASTPSKDLIQSHMSIGFDRTPFMEDPNISFPADRLRELVTDGTIGSLATNFYSFMGAQRNPRTIEQESGPEVGRLLRLDNVDLVLLTPT